MNKQSTKIIKIAKKLVALKNEGIKLYIANLGVYNEGKLMGKWFDLDDYADGDDLRDDITKMLKEHSKKNKRLKGMADEEYGEYEEYAIHDYECSFLKIDEYDNLDKLVEINNAFNNSNDPDAFKVFLENEGGLDIDDDIDDLLSNFEELYVGYYYDFDEFAVEEFNRCFEVPDNLVDYIDYKRYARDLKQYFIEIDGCIFRR